jgi:ATP-dependent exoDNAse (exonuclease V) alpha subunit
VLSVVTRLAALVRQRLLTVVLLMAAVSLLTAGMGAIATFVVMAGGRVVAQLGILVVGVDVPAQQLMAGLFGHGLRSLGATGMPAGSTGHAAAALVGGGVVFALALVLPGLVYLRGTCAVYLAMTDAAPTE